VNTKKTINNKLFQNIIEETYHAKKKLRRGKELSTACMMMMIQEEASDLTLY